MPRKVSSKKTSKLSFQKEFYSDLTVDNMLFAMLIRSPVSQGIVKSISHPDLPEGYTLVTARDVPGVNLIDTSNGKIPLFCEGNISYEGEPLGLLVGPDELYLKSLIEELVITIDTNTIEDYLPDESDFNNYDDPDKKRTKKEIKTQNEEIKNIKEIKEKFFSDKLAQRTIKAGPCFDKKDEDDFAAIEKVFSSSKNVLENEWKYALKIPDYREPNGALCIWKDSSLTIFTPTQWLTNLRQVASTTLAIKPETINIKKTTSLNRGTNSIWYNSIIACQVAVASKKTGLPVKLVFSRDEQEKFLNTMQPVTIKHKTCANEKGELEAMQIQIDMNVGFANPFAQEIIDRLVIASCGCYKAKNILVTAIAHSSFSPASSVDIQLIDSAAFFAIENQMNELCKKCNLMPIEFRQKNYLEISKKQARSPFWFQIEKFNETLEAIAKSSDFNRKYAAYHLDSMDWKIKNGPKEYVSVFSSPMRGIGFACAFEGTGYYDSKIFSTTQALEVTMETESTLVIHCPPISNSIHEIWAKLASEILGIPFLIVKIDSVLKNGEEPPLPENVYSNISLMTSLLKKCCIALKNKKTTTALPITVKKKFYSTTKNEWNSDSFSGKPFYSTSFIAATVELEINPCTYREQIRNINIIVNGGKILNTKNATTTIKLGVQKVLISLLEDDKIECQNIKVLFMQSEREPSQIGELIYQVIPAAYTQALTQALNCTINSLPLTTKSLFEKIKERKAILKSQEEATAKEMQEGQSNNQNEGEAKNENSTNIEQ